MTIVGGGIGAAVHPSYLGSADGRVRGRDDTRATLGGLEVVGADVGILLDAVASVGEPVRPSFLWRPSSRDADDDMVLEVAVNGRADAIVTFNRRDFRPATAQFGIEVLLPGAAIERLGGIS